MKAGSLDNYILTTKPQYLDSKFGTYLKSLIQEKQRDPTSFKMPYIPGTSEVKKSKKTKKWEYKRIPSMYVPAHVKSSMDMS